MKKECKILIIDDDTTMLDMITLALLEIENKKNPNPNNYNIITAKSGEEGLELFEVHQPPVVLLDVNLGGMSGFDVLADIKKKYPPCQVIMITGYSDTSLVITAIREGACDFIEKPFGIELCRHVVSKCVEKWQLLTENQQYQHELQDLVKEQTQSLESSVDDLHHLLHKTVDSLVKTIEARDPYTAGHQQRVMNISVKIGRLMERTDVDLECLKMSALLHDIGKIYVPTSLLSKPSALSDNEFNLIKDHCNAGYEILQEIPFPYDLAQTVVQHHERMDGTGYPNQLKGGEILINARILGVCDVVEAMSSHRPYRASLGIDLAIQEITEGKGTKYDPISVEACLKVIEDNDKDIDKIFGGESG